LGEWPSNDQKQIRAKILYYLGEPGYNVPVFYVTKMKVLIACEYSGIVRDAFLAKGHNVISCDLLPTESPGPHYQGDVFDIINDGFDMMIAHPPCNFISFAGNRAFKNNPERIKDRDRGLDFFIKLYNAPINKICIENPMGYAHILFTKCSQIIHPWYFGDKEMKRTCLWLKNLPMLYYALNDNLFGKATSAGIPKPIHTIKRKSGPKKGKDYNYYFMQGKTAHERARTFPAIAQAMADQWG
jgi:hypothetical protein